MAKKNSSKTATEKSIQASEPRTLNYRAWKGVNFVDAPLTWEPLEVGPGKFRQTDLPTNYLMVQNNLDTTDTLGLETRRSSINIGDSVTINDYVYKFTGVAKVYKHWLFAAARSNGTWHEVILYRDLKSDSTTTWTPIRLRSNTTNNPTHYSIEEIGFFESTLVVTTRNADSNVGVLFLAAVTVGSNDASITITGTNWSGDNIDNYVTDTPEIADPDMKLDLTMKNMNQASEATDDAPVRVEVCFCYTNRLGSTMTNADIDTDNISTTFVEFSKTLWTTHKFMVIKPLNPNYDDDNPSLYPRNVDPNIVPGTSIRGIDLYARDLENIDWVFIGHVNVMPDPEKPDGIAWSYNWYGNMSDISQWMTSQLMVPTENTTRGPDATHFSCHDSRIYYWGMPKKPYRLYIGGNPGSEFSVARGLGGAWVDIEPGSGFDVMGTAKWKTTSGANIVTIMCGNRNTTQIKRFNLVETNLTITNEVSYKSYMYEEVSNVVGCNSRWGYGVFTDGLYSLSRYGLMLTTMAMEYNSQMKNQCMSDVIEPIFMERLGKRLRDCRMVCINDVIYIALSEDEAPEEGVIGLDNVILCYDINLQAWYTWTHDQTLDQMYGSDPDKILHIFAVDSDEFVEGLGVITSTQIRLYPVTGIQAPDIPPFQVIMETGELIPRQPVQAFWYVQQLEFRFDYFIGDPGDPAVILIEGVDYYGRHFSIEKKLNYTARDWPEWNENGIAIHHIVLGDNPVEWTEQVEQRSYVEWIRVDKLVESLRIRLKGKARFRLTHINCKAYQQADTIGTPYGFDANDSYRNRYDEDTQIHHYINDYNNLRRAVVT